MTQFQISLSYAFHNKDLKHGGGQTVYGDSFVTTQSTPQELFEHITSGNTFAVGTYSGNRTKENFIQSQTLWLDYDDNVSIADCLEVPFIRDNAFMLYSSGTSSPEYYKARVGFQLDVPITDSAEYTRIVLALFEACKPLISDAQCKDSARLFYGSTNRTEEPILNASKITLLASLTLLADDLELQLEEQRTEEMNILIRARNSQRMKSDSTALEAYANKALDNMVSELSNMSEGGRNNTAFKFGASMGNMASAGMIEAHIAETSLIAAAIASGLSHFESLAVSRGMQRGMQTPFDTSKLQTQKEKKQSVDKQFKERKVELKTKPAPAIIETLPDLYDSDLLPAGRKSWVAQATLPKAWIQAVLTLSDTRSAVATLLIKLHEVFLTGALNPNNFTLKEIRDTIYDGKRRPSTKSALDTLKTWGVVRDNGAYSIYKDKPNYPLHYEIDFDAELVSMSFLSMLERYILEHHTDKELAPRLPSILHELDLDTDSAKAWKARCDKSVSDETAYRIKSDMRYWLELLIGDSRYEPLGYTSDADNIELRALLLTEFLNGQATHIETTRPDGKKHTKIIPNQIQMSQPEIMRLCGLKSASFKSIFKEASVTTDLRFKWHSVNNPNSCDLLQELSNATQAKNNDGRGGHLVWMSIKPIGGKYGKPIYKRSEMLAAWEKLKSGDENQPTIFGINIRVQLPSLVRFKTADEIKEAEQKAIKVAIEKEAAKESVSANVAPTVIEIVDKPSKPKRKARYSATQDRDWNSHDKTWIHEQLQVEMYSWLNQKLTTSGHVLDADNQLIKMLTSDSDIIRYINKHAGNKPINTINDFYEGAILSKPNEPEKEDVPEIIIEPIAPRQVKTKKRYMTLAETRAWGLADDKVEYLQSIGMK